MSKEVIDSLIKFENRPVELWSVWNATFLTALMGIVNILSAVTPAFAFRIRLIDEFLPLIVRRSGRLSAAVAGFALVLLSGKLKQRKEFDLNDFAFLVFLL